MALSHKRALVLGLGRSGEAAVAALERAGVEVVSADRKLGNDGDASLLDGVDLLVKSPGVPGEAALVVEARQRGVPVWSELELGYRLLAPVRIVGITGTNGKTTTTELLAAIFRAAGRDIVVAGNEHEPLSSIRETEWVVCEVSSFQLEDVHEFACEVAVLLNLEPDHLDRHGTFEAYRTAKLRILERARHRVVPSGMGLEGVAFSARDLLPAEPLIRGDHNRENAAAATAAARVAGIGDQAIAEALGTFAGVPHRLEVVAEVDSVRWVNDSKATNTAAARRGISAYADSPLRLILGGSLKGEPFDPVAESIGPNVRSVHLIGAATDELAAALDRVGVRYSRDGDLTGAVAAAAAVSDPGDVVLLSPACASYDQYENFERRGEEFRRLVQNLAR